MFLAYTLFAALTWLSCAQVTSTGSFEGVLAFRNTLQRIPTFSAPCCAETYHEVAYLTATASSLNFSSTGISLSCGPSPPGWFAFTNLKSLSANCYAGDLVVGPGVAYGRGKVFWDGAVVRTSIYGNSDQGDCNFANVDTLQCSGSNKTFYQPIVGQFVPPAEPNGEQEFDGIFVTPSCTSNNCYLIHDDDRLLVVDSGLDEISVNKLIDDINTLLKNNDEMEFRAIFITHSHRDHMNGVTYLSKAFPDVPIYVASEQILVETGIEYTNYKGGQDITGVLQILGDPTDLWDGDDVPLVLTENTFGYVGETTYFSMLWFTERRLLFAGDFLYSQSNMWLGSADFVAQCSWINSLVHTRILIEDETTIFPGHGPVTNNVADIFTSNIEYLLEARSAYALTCYVDQTKNWLLEKYPAYAGDADFIIGYGASARVPSQAIALGCDCSGKATRSCVDQGIVVPVCHVHVPSEDDCDSPESCGLRDDGLSGGAVAGIVIGSVAVAALLLVAVALLAMGKGGGGGGGEYTSFN